MRWLRKPDRELTLAVLLPTVAIVTSCGPRDQTSFESEIERQSSSRRGTFSNLLHVDSPYQQVDDSCSYALRFTRPLELNDSDRAESWELHVSARLSEWKSFYRVSDSGGELPNGFVEIDRQVSHDGEFYQTFAVELSRNYLRERQDEGESFRFYPRRGSPVELRLQPHFIQEFLDKVDAVTESNAEPTRSARDTGPIAPVTGGSLTTEAPWIIHYVVSGTLCSGIVLSEHWILTAAHCLVDMPRALTNIQVRYANGLGTWETVYNGQALVHIPPAYNPSRLSIGGDAEDDVALIHLTSFAGVAPPGIPLAKTGKAKLYVPYTSFLWTDPDAANRLFSLIGWGRTDPSGGADCVMGTAGMKRLGTNLTLDVADKETELLKADIGQTHACQGDSGTPWLFIRGGTHIAFAIHSGRRWDFGTFGREHQGAAIAPKMPWFYETSRNLADHQYLSCERVGYAAGIPYSECTERRAPVEDPTPFPCPPGLHCCEPGPDNTCLLCIPRDRECP